MVHEHEDWRSPPRPMSAGRKKSAMHSHGSLRWRGKVKRIHSDDARLVLPDDEVVALGVGGEVPVGHLGDEEVGLLGLGQLLAQDRPDPLLERRRRPRRPRAGSPTGCGTGRSGSGTRRCRRWGCPWPPGPRRRAGGRAGCRWPRRGPGGLALHRRGLAAPRGGCAGGPLRSEIRGRSRGRPRRSASAPPGGPWCAAPRRRRGRRRRARRRPRGGRARRRCASGRPRPGGPGCATGERSFSSSRFSRMISVDLTRRPLMPMASALCSSAAAIISLMPHLDAEVDDLVAVVGQDDVDQVLPDVVDVALDGGQHDGPLAALVRPSPCGARGRRRRPSSSRPTGARRAAASRPRRRARRRSSCPPAGSR